MTLTQAITEIQKRTGRVVTGIQFEDGSGFHFNFQLGGGSWQFISLRPIFRAPSRVF